MQIQFEQNLSELRYVTTLSVNKGLAMNYVRTWMTQERYLLFKFYVSWPPYYTFMNIRKLMSSHLCDKIITYDFLCDFSIIFYF